MAPSKATTDVASSHNLDGSGTALMARVTFAEPVSVNVPSEFIGAVASLMTPMCPGHTEDVENVVSNSGDPISKSGDPVGLIISAGQIVVIVLTE